MKSAAARGGARREQDAGAIVRAESQQCVDQDLLEEVAPCLAAAESIAQALPRLRSIGGTREFAARMRELERG